MPDNDVEWAEKKLSTLTIDGSTNVAYSGKEVTTEIWTLQTELKTHTHVYYTIAISKTVIASESHNQMYIHS